jgi:cyanate permease
LTNVEREQQDLRVQRSRNRKFLLVLVALCVVLATLGFLYASWLFTLPSVVKPGGH